METFERTVMSSGEQENSWTFYRSVLDGEELLIARSNIWDLQWQATGESVIVKDPIYGEPHRLAIYEARSGESVIRFAAGEFSNLVWGFYLPKIG